MTSYLANMSLVLKDTSINITSEKLLVCSVEVKLLKWAWDLDTVMILGKRDLLTLDLHLLSQHL